MHSKEINFLLFIFIEVQMYCNDNSSCSKINVYFYTKLYMHFVVINYNSKTIATWKKGDKEIQSNFSIYNYDALFM